MEASSIGASYSDAAPPGLVGCVWARGYNDAASTVLPSQRRSVARLDALQAEVAEVKRLPADTATKPDGFLPAILYKALNERL